MANNQDHVWHILRDLLELLAGAGIPTPERGYALDGGWSLALSDLRRLVNDRNALRAQIKTAIAERDQLRAELAAAKNLIARIHRDGGHHTEEVGFAQSVADADAKVSEWLLAAEERTALAAHVERLREKGFKMRAAISGAWSADRMTSVADSLRPVIQDPECDRDALASTPAQSLAAHDAAVKVAVLREVAGKLAEMCKKLERTRTHPITWEACEEWVLAEADRIEKEAPHA